MGGREVLGLLVSIAGYGEAECVSLPPPLPLLWFGCLPLAQVGSASSWALGVSFLFASAWAEGAICCPLPAFGKHGLPCSLPAGSACS